MKLSSEEVYLPFIFLSGRACHGSGPTSLIRDTQCVSNSSEPHILDLGCVRQAFSSSSSELFYKSRDPRVLRQGFCPSRACLNLNRSFAASDSREDEVPNSNTHFRYHTPSHCLQFILLEPVGSEREPGLSAHWS
jgi:hypothetical protein